MKTIFEKDLSGEIVSPNEPGYEALITDIFATIRTATEMNTGYRTPEEVPGEGLLIYENVILPFKNPIPKNTQLYQIMTTRLGEGATV